MPKKIQVREKNAPVSMQKISVSTHPAYTSVDTAMQMETMQSSRHDIRPTRMREVRSKISHPSSLWIIVDWIGPYEQNVNYQFDNRRIISAMDETVYDIFITDKDRLLCIHLFRGQVCLHISDAGLEIFYLPPSKILQNLFLLRVWSEQTEIYERMQ